MPLMIAVFGLGFGVLLLILLSAAFSSKGGLHYDTSFWFLFLSMPMMYATGVGILLVGIEKETRSMQWMRSLPVGGASIAWNKLLVALVTLSFVWMISLVSWAIFATALGAPLSVVGALYRGGNESGGWLLVDYLLVSLFLCLAGLAFAWRFESPILSLVMLVPAALAIWLPSYGIVEWFDFRSSNLGMQRVVDTGVYLVGLTIGSIVALVYGWRASQRELAASSAPIQESGALARFPAIFGAEFVGGTRSEARSAEAWSLWPSVTPLSGMLWQMIRQNGRWWSIIGLASLGVLTSGSYCNMMGHSHPIDDAWVFWVFFPLAVLSGLLGVLAFQSDGIQQRVRFYADRGVSPTMLWLTRHWIPITIVLFIAIARYLLLRLANPANSQLNLVDAFVVLAGCLAAYTVGQWVSQSVKSPILALIVLPAVLATNLAYCIFAVVAMEAPWWVLIFSFAITAISTWWMMRTWMEQRIDWKYYLQHSVFSMVSMIIPIVPGLWKICNLPNMPSEVRTKLEQLAIQNPAARQTRPIVSFGQYLSTVSGGAVAGTVLAHNEKVREYQHDQLISQVADSEFWLQAGDPRELLKAYLAELAALQSSLLRDQDDTVNDDEVSLTRYRQAMARIPKIVEGLRATGRLRFCDIAELIELTVLGHCRYSKARELMGDAVYQSVAQLLADDQARDQSRRVALANAWWELNQGFDSRRPVLAYGLDGYPIQYLSSGFFGVQTVSIPSSIASLRSRDLYVADLWRLLELPLGSKQALGQRGLIDSRNAYSMRMPADGRYFGIEDYSTLSPAETWRGEWEVLAKELVVEDGSRE